MAFSIPIHKCLKGATAAKCVAVVLLCLAYAVPSRGMEAVNAHPILEAELLVAQGDLSRLANAQNLPLPHKAGLRERVLGSLGLLPWLLKQAGDRQGAIRLQAVAARLDRDATWIVGPVQRVLEDLIQRHPLDVGVYDPRPLSATQRREGKAIHDTYCAGCHDGAGSGNADMRLPARDLFLMARETDLRSFLARLIIGVKGDETLLFVNPLTQSQIASLWWYYLQVSQH